MNGTISCTSVSATGECIGWDVAIVQEMATVDPVQWSGAFGGGFAVTFGLFVVGVMVGMLFKVIREAQRA